MGRLGTILSPDLLPGFSSYFDYQERVCREAVIPWLDQRLSLNGLNVGDFGAHEGGMLHALREGGWVRTAVGFELSHEVVASSPFKSDACFRLIRADVTALEPATHSFDLILMHDVLEHVPDYARALEAVFTLLAPGGSAFISFPPYYSAFGGHQQLASGFARVAPYIHYLPAPLFFRLARPAANEYMSSSGSLDDMLSVRKTRLTLSRAERAFEGAGLQIVDRELFLIRPEYTIRYGLRTRAARLFGRIPGFREVLVNGGYYLLRR